MRYKYYLDFGTGYELIEIYNNSLKLKSWKELSLMIESKQLLGSFSLIGSAAERAFNIRTSDYYLPFKIEAFNGTSWNLLHECNVDLRGKYNRLSKTLEVTKFKERNRIESEVASSLDNTLKTNQLGVFRRGISKTYASTKLEILGVNTDLDKDAYKNSYDIEGNSVSYYDTRWDYFLWQETIGVSPNLQHVYATRKFDIKPQLNGTTNGYNEILYNSNYIWVKLPPDPYTNESWIDFLIKESYRLDEVLNAIVSGINSSLSFDSADSGVTNWDSLNSYLGDGNEFDGKKIQGIKFTLGKLFNFWKTFYNIDWFIDNNKLKFQNNPYKYYSTSLDWSDDSIYIDEVSFIKDILPDAEEWGFLDTSLDRYYLSYFKKGVETSNNVLKYGVDILHDIITLQEGGLSGNKLIWITLDSGGNAFVRSPKQLFELYSKDRVYSEYAPYEVPINPSSAYIPLASFDTQPIYKVKINKVINDYSSFDLFSKITISGGNVGYLNEYEIDLNTGIATFYIFFSTFVL